MGHNGRHPKTGFQVTPLYSELAAGTSEVVASFADAFTSGCVLTEPAPPEDVTAAESLIVYLLSGLSVIFCRHSTAVFHGRDPAVWSLASLCSPVVDGT